MDTISGTIVNPSSLMPAYLGLGRSKAGKERGELADKKRLEIVKILRNDAELTFSDGSEKLKASFGSSVSPEIYLAIRRALNKNSKLTDNEIVEEAMRDPSLRHNHRYEAVKSNPGVKEQPKKTGISPAQRAALTKVRKKKLEKLEEERKKAEAQKPKPAPKQKAPVRKPVEQKPVVKRDGGAQRLPVTIMDTVTDLSRQLKSYAPEGATLTLTTGQGQPARLRVVFTGCVEKDIPA